METLIGSPFHAAFRFCEDIDESEKTVGGIRISGFAEVSPECFGEALAFGFGIKLYDNERSNCADDFAEELREIFSAFELLMDDRERFGGFFV
ncbi:hypothetical protein OAF87_04050 [Akkermansiaceae bacterium]|nr:hypothetical protein [Akkermansiaceae bacterium]